MLPFGPLAGTARELALLLSDPERTAVAVVTRAEEMAVNVTLEHSSAIMRVGVPLLPTIVNAVAPLRFSRAELRRLLKEPPDVPASLRPHAAAGAFSAARQRAAEREIRRLGRALATSPVALPLLATQRFTPAAIDELADAIERVGTRRRARAVA